MSDTPYGAAALQDAALRFLRRFGLAAAAWSALLAATTPGVARPGVLAAGIAVVVGWALVSQLVRRPKVWFWGWAAVAVGVELLGPLAGTPGRSVAGGISFMVLVAAALTRRRWPVATAVLALSSVALLRGVVRPGWSVTGTVGTILLFVFGGVALVWLVDAVSRAQEARDALLVRATAAEREAAVQRERGEAAARLHDSVLQTLTAIGRAEQPDDAARLATRASAELRDFLDRAQRGEQGSLAEALRAAVTRAADGAAVGVATAGDAPLDDAGAALVDAAAEAVRNATRHGAPPVRVLLECGPERTQVWVADRGAGFDPDAVPAGRLGVRGSIVDRVQRVGGSATLDCEDGCEWELAVPVGGHPGDVPEPPPGR